MVSITRAALAASIAATAVALAPQPRVVVTGLGAVTGIGNTYEAMWSSLLEGATGIAKVSCFEDVERFGSHVGCEVRDFEGKEWFASPKSANSNDRYTHLAMAAARQAVEDADLHIDESEGGATHPERVGVMIGSAFGGIGTARDRREAMLAIQRGDCDAVVCGGSEAAMTPLMYGGFGAMKAMCTKYNDDPEKASRPFDADRAGFVMGEGAGVVVIESLEHAEARGAKPYCELAGYGATCDAHHITTPAPGGAGLAKCLESALRYAGVAPSEVDYVNAHGTSTAYNDKFETMALKTVFGDHAPQLLVSSTKGATGHTMGAAGGIEAVIAALAVAKDTAPPTINLETPDPDCDLNYVAAGAEKATVNVAVTENLGFGGHNGALVMKKL
ncbi:3-oxoacyl-[acyl-carrier-protein] synthase [Aureococcus anophagefferens]|nr:3-oxoacyl-[acyl-carrier-protein] synthase [Aureococcus anophagefferens]